MKLPALSATIDTLTAKLRRNSAKFRSPFFLCNRFFILVQNNADYQGLRRGEFVLQKIFGARNLAEMLRSLVGWVEMVDEIRQLVALEEGLNDGF